MGGLSTIVVSDKQITLLTVAGKPRFLARPTYGLRAQRVTTCWEHPTQGHGRSVGYKHPWTPRRCSGSSPPALRPVSVDLRGYSCHDPRITSSTPCSGSRRGHAGRDCIQSPGTSARPWHARGGSRGSLGGWHRAAGARRARPARPPALLRARPRRPRGGPRSAEGARSAGPPSSSHDGIVLGL